ncbi:MAG: 3-hydroxyacyl-CoA dehydrogenase family protein, partial [Deltaproteobacteria bacterium]
LDRAMEAFGMPMGPIELADVVGLDICVAVGHELAPGVEPPGQALLLAHLSVPEDTVDPSEVRRLALLVRSALRDLYPEAAIAWERSWVRRGESGDPLAVPRLPEALSTHPALRLAGWSVGVPGQESCGATGAALSGRAAAEALLAAHAPG